MIVSEIIDKLFTSAGASPQERVKALELFYQLVELNIANKLSELGVDASFLKKINVNAVKDLDTVTQRELMSKNIDNQTGKKILDETIKLSLNQLLEAYKNNLSSDKFNDIFSTIN